MRHLVLCAMFLAGSLHAGESDLDAGLAAYEHGRYAEALRHFRPLADAGLAVAQYRLGLMNGAGEALPLDHEEAVRWYRLAALQGHRDAAFRLGRMHYQGRDVAPDERKARKWLLQAAHQGHPKAQYMAAFLALWPLEPDGRIRAYAWFSLSADQGNAFAAERRDILGRHLGVDGVARAEDLARRWFNAASG